MSSLSLHLLPLLCVIILVFNTILSKSVIVEGCQSCLFPPLQHRLRHQSHHHHSVAGMAATTWKRHSTQFSSSSTTTAILYNNNGGGFCIVALRKVLQRLQGKQIMVTPFVVTATGMLISQRIRQSNRIFRSNEEEEKEGKEQSEEESKEKTTSKPVTAAMVSTIGIYKNFISPLLPPACRFLPTCSQYGVQAIEEFGPSKGVVLTAWRIMRCTPFGGKGYDPPKWPPVPYNYGSY